MESYRSQASDYLDKWNVKFTYNKAGILQNLLKESTEGDQEIEKNWCLPIKVFLNIQNIQMLKAGLSQIVKY